MGTGQVKCKHEGRPCPIEGISITAPCTCSCDSCEEARYWDNWRQPCQTCGAEGPCKPDCAEDKYNRELAERVERLGPELAMLPDLIECYACGRNPLMLLTPSRLHVGDLGFKYVLQPPVGLGPIAEAHRDPTQTYRLKCGHLEM
jgi:hypothetical protein